MVRVGPVRSGRAPAPRSATRSAASSIPTERRMRLSGTSSGEPAADAWVIAAGVLDQALDRTERLGEREDLGRVGDAHGRIPSRGHGERNHAAEVAHLLGRGGVAGMVGQLRVEHPVDGGMGGEQVDDGPGVLAVAVHPQRQRLHPAQHEIAVERRGDRACRVLGEPEPFGRARRRSTAMKPPTTSLWPPRYFVDEWTTMSAPSVSGCWRYGRGERVVDDDDARRGRGRWRRSPRCRSR